MTACISIAGRNKSFHGFQALHDIDLSIAPGETVALIGASGSGKSTLLRHIAGLACADVDSRGAIDVFGRTVQCGGGWRATYATSVRKSVSSSSSSI